MGGLTSLMVGRTPVVVLDVGWAGGGTDDGGTGGR